ncbi:MAG: ferritin-like domain-containing protein [Flavipsychrobacter sp.]|nr:ferritin-like domain-containing protein [Flavipsychrobacter sp.]
MKLTDILNEVSKASPEVFENKADRRDILKNFGLKIAAVATPFAVSSLWANKAQAKTTDVLAEAIVYVLKLGYMQADFYRQALMVPGLIPASDVSAFEKIKKDKDAHVAYWIFYLNATNNAVPKKNLFDFSVKGAISKVFTDYNTFLSLAHAIEDAGVRMYLDSTKNLLTNKAFRIDAINIATTNARHAAHVRMLRRNLGVNMMPWVTGTEANSIIGEIRKAYQIEDNTKQLNQTTVGINGFDISASAATEAFDEPMLEVDGLQFINPFITN